MLIALNESSPAIRFLCKNDKRLEKVIKLIGPISYTPHFDDSYSFLVSEIIAQMLSAKASIKIFSRLEKLCGGDVAPDVISTLSDEQIRSIGISTAKVSYIRNLTTAIETCSIDFNDLLFMSDEQVIRKLTNIRGIGKWSANMYLIFALDRQDVLPTEDVAFLQAYKWLYSTSDCTEAAIKEKCQIWSPYSSIAARYLYRALDIGLVKQENHLSKLR